MKIYVTFNVLCEDEGHMEAGSLALWTYVFKLYLNRILFFGLVSVVQTIFKQAQ